LLALLCALLLSQGDTTVYAQQQDASQEQTAPKIPNDQLDALVAPIALYPDPLLSQVLVASTYPLEIIHLQQWLAQHNHCDCIRYRMRTLPPPKTLPIFIAVPSVEDPRHVRFGLWVFWVSR
jgi:hypothetical protein